MSMARSPEPPFYSPTFIPGPPWQALVEEGRLHRADVVLTHGKIGLNPFSWVSWFIRLFTRSYWNHVALVYVIRNITLGYDNTFVIESEGSGIDIHNVSKYLERPGNDIAIKRLEAPWFTNPSEQPGGGVWFQRQVRGFALNEIDASYDFGRIFLIGLGVAARLLGQVFLFVSGLVLVTLLVLGSLLALLYLLGSLLGISLPDPFVLLGFLLTLFGLLVLLAPARRALRRAGSAMGWGGRAVVQSGHRLKRALQDSFICSGFVQYAYYYAVHRVAPTDTNKLAAVSFNLELGRVDPADTAQWEDVLRSTTPADLGRSRSLRWRYVVKEGRLWEIGVPDHIVQQGQLTVDQVMEMEERQVEAILKGTVVPQ